MRERPGALLFLLLLFGCGSFDGETCRSEHVVTSLTALTERTERILSEREPLDLEDCLDIALEHNLGLRMAELDAGLSTLNRKIAFANFLPVIQVTGRSHSLDRQPMVDAGGGAYFTMQDRRIEEAAVNLQWSIFLPSTWFLYSARLRREEIGELMRVVAAQGIRMEVTACFYRCLALEESLRAEATVKATAEQLLRGAVGGHREGYLDDARLGESRLHLEATETELARLQRAEKIAKAELMALMGLYPLRTCVLEKGAPPEPPSGSMEEWITQALLRHPLLHVADREVEINRRMAHAALADFLPQLMGFGGFSYTSNSYMRYSTAWSLGLSGVMTVFNGFANVHAYQMACEREKRSWVRREETTLSVILQVLRAQSLLDDARGNAELARKRLDLATLSLNHARAKWREGLFEPGDLLREVSRQAQAARDQQVLNYQVHIAVAALHHAIGIEDEKPD